MSNFSSELRDQAFRWIADDPDPESQQELQRVVAMAMARDQAAIDELADRMNGTLTFGTAGLRGPVRAGPNGMNRAVVIRTTAGVANWLRSKDLAGTVVVGRDARHGSETFAQAAASVLNAAGFAVRVVPDPLPTPVTAYLIRALGAVAGIQITASHNPPADNGYKLYLGDGAQIAPPDDRMIEAAIRGVPAARMVTVSDAGVLPVSAAELDGYSDRVASLPRGTAREVRVVLTPMHGVGGATAVEALRRSGFTDVQVVREQATPDPEFPTVTFPNPEEPGATDLLLGLASTVDADLAVALDPDGDRCALGVRGRDGSWRMLRGDETGSLLGYHILSTVDRMAHPDTLVATTIVSSSLLKSIAAAHGSRYDETLTGFKWLVRAGDGRGTGLIYAYEEALGHCCDPDFVRDKDGISAAVLAADLAATLKAAGRTLLDVLDELAVQHGLHVTEPVTVRVDEPARLLGTIRANPPSTLGELVVTCEDLLPGVNALRLSADRLRVVIRPSGTEPKLKAYIEVVEPVGDPSRLDATRTAAATRIAEIRAAVSELLGA